MQAERIQTSAQGFGSASAGNTVGYCGSCSIMDGATERGMKTWELGSELVQDFVFKGKAEVFRQLKHGIDSGFRNCYFSSDCGGQLQKEEIGGQELIGMISLN